MKKEQPTYVEQLEESLHQLIQLVVDPGLYNFLTTKERKQLSKVLLALPKK